MQKDFGLFSYPSSLKQDLTKNKRRMIICLGMPMKRGHFLGYIRKYFLLAMES